MTGSIGIIGFGNIAQAIITPLLDKKLISPGDVFCLVNSKKSLEFLEENYEDVKHSSNNRQHTRFNFQDIDNDEDESNPVNCVSQ